MPNVKNSLILEARDVVKHLGVQKMPVLKGVSLGIQAGEFISITGPSGSGKTTLLYLLGALDTPTEGEILIQGKATSQMKDAELTQLRQNKLGFVFQFHFLLPEFSALDNVAIPAIMAGEKRSEAQAKARDLLGKMGLSQRIDHRPGELSGGEQQRVALARALINDPILLLADEPTGNLDSQNTENIFEFLKQLNREHNLAVVLVTHDLELAAQSERQLHVLDGQIQ